MWGNDPLNNTDPSGLRLEDLCIGETVALGTFIAETSPVWAPVVARATAGFGLGYGAATLSGVKSTEGRLLAGAVGAVGLPVGSVITGGAAELVGAGTTTGAAASLTTGGVVAYATGFGGEAAGQYGDVSSGYRTTYSLPSMSAAGLATTGAYLLGGEGAITAVGGLGLIPEGATEVTTGIVSSTGTTLGGLGGQTLLESGGAAAASQQSGGISLQGGGSPMK